MPKAGESASVTVARHQLTEPRAPGHARFPLRVPALTEYAVIRKPRAIGIVLAK